MRRLTLFLAVVLALALAVFAGPVAAAPITCPSPQVAVHDGDGWDCVNRGGNESGAAETRNPND